jgi:hypothetical protein
VNDDEMERILEVRRHSLILIYYTGISMEGLSKTTETLSQDSQSPRPRFEPGPSKYKAQVSTTRSQWLMMNLTITIAINYNLNFMNGKKI